MAQGLFVPGASSLGAGGHRAAFGNAGRVQILGTKFGPASSWASGANGDGSHHGMTSRLRSDMPAYDMELKFVEYWNGRISFSGAGEIAGANAVTAKAAWEPQGQTVASIPLYAADLSTRSVSIPAGARQRFYPASTLIVPGSSFPYCRSFVNVTGTQTFPVTRTAHNQVNSLGESVNYFSPNAGVDYTDGVGEFSTGTGALYAWAPSGIYGIPADRKRRRCVWILGDSRCIYSGVDATTPFGDTNGFTGWVEKKIQTQYSFINSSRASSRLYWRVAGMANELALCGPYVTDVVLDMGINDLNDGRTLAQLQADFATLINALHNYGLRVHVVTQTPNPAGTSNAWLDGGSSLKAMDTVRQALNTWLRTLPLGVHSCIDVCAYVEDPGRPGYWIANSPAVTPEGLHDSATGQALKGNALNLNIFT